MKGVAMSDAMARRLAVQPDRSVLVQAPAGSGKTTLLVERYIALLACVEAPEEILAITFTRKAAAEMRRRILGYLDPSYEEWLPYEKGIQERVLAVADQVSAWGLLDNPQRMQIRTIDSFCHSLARTMPIASQLGPVPRPADQPQRLYRAAAREALEGKDIDGDESACQKLLAWCDHNHHQVESLIAQLLAKREQWLRIIGSSGTLDRSTQDALLSWVVERTLSEARDALLSAFERHHLDITQLLGALSEAGHWLQANDNVDSPFTALSGISELPEASVDQLEIWKQLAGALVKKTGGWRKQFTKSQGFAPKTIQKDQISAIVDALENEIELADRLFEVTGQPDPHYSDGEWEILEALVDVLRAAAVRLTLLFAQTGQSDFTAMSTAALQGLGDEESGFSDLALYLDRTIRHILIDEYQDTNQTQFRLLEKLLQGWESEPERTLFVVGDPMQSIYRFREAEVGLFVQTRDRGIQGHQLEAANLTDNFRSSRTIVDWVNRYLGPLFPMQEDIAAGAIAYALSKATIDEPGEVLTLGFETREEEAEAVVDHIENALIQHANDPDYSAAIIVRARSHLGAIIPELQQRNIRFRAVKLDKLIDRPVVQDLMALTRLILNPQERSSILALLRSPMVGLTLSELVTLTQESHAALSRDQLEALPNPAKHHALRVFDLIDQLYERIGRRPLAELVEGAWYRLGGPACHVHNNPDQQMSEAAAYLDALAHAESNGLLADWNDFLEWLEGSTTDGGPNNPDVKLDVLTMHAAKGLEWDTVVIPSLQAQPNQSDQSLLYWLPVPLEEEEHGVLIAPLSASTDNTSSPRVSLIKREQRLRERFESLRLMYVATTRAKNSLWLSAVIPTSSEKEFKPVSGSLLETIWPSLSGSFQTPMTKTKTSVDNKTPSDRRGEIEIVNPEVIEPPPVVEQALYRPPENWSPSWPSALAWTPIATPRAHTDEIEFNWAGAQARRTGTVMHYLLEAVGKIGLESVQGRDIARLCDKIPSLLAMMGTRPNAIEQVAKELERTFRAVLDSPTGQWILSNQHQDPHCEYALAGWVDGQWVHAVIDRTFIDAEGKRWIIDYKSGHHAGSDLAGFLEQEANRYQEQLALYARLFEQLGTEPIVTALYLPHHDALQVIGDDT